MKEQTISNLKKLKSFHNGSYGADIDRAIQALEQQPCEDCISREEALRHRHIIHDDDGIGYSVVRVDEIIDLPSVIPQPKTGEWIYTGDYFTEGMCRCSKCGVEIDPSEARKFCFECGSYNGGGEE